MGRRNITVQQRGSGLSLMLFLLVFVVGFCAEKVHAEEPTPFPESPSREYNRIDDKTYIEAGATLPQDRERKRGLRKVYDDEPDKYGATSQFGMRIEFKGKKPKSMNHVKVYLSFYFRKRKRVSEHDELNLSSLSNNNLDYIYGQGDDTPLDCLAYTGSSLQEPEDTLRVSLPPKKINREKTNDPTLNEAREKRKRETEREVSDDRTEIEGEEYYVLLEPITFITHERIYYEPISGSKALKLFSHNLALKFPFGKTGTLPKKITKGLHRILNDLQPRR